MIMCGKSKDSETGIGTTGLLFDQQNIFLFLFCCSLHTNKMVVYLHPLKLPSPSSSSMMESKRNKAQCSIVPVPTVNQPGVLGAGCRAQCVVCILKYSVCSVHSYSIPD